MRKAKRGKDRGRRESACVCVWFVCCFVLFFVGGGGADRKKERERQRGIDCWLTDVTLDTMASPSDNFKMEN